MPNDKTLAEHLKKARDARDEAKLREHAKRIASRSWSTRPRKPCNCGNADKADWHEHRSACPVYWRGRKADRKGEETK